MLPVIVVLAKGNIAIGPLRFGPATPGAPATHGSRVSLWQGLGRL